MGYMNMQYICTYRMHLILLIILSLITRPIICQDPWESFKNGIGFSLGGIVVTLCALGIKTGAKELYSYFTKTPAQKKSEEAKKKLEPFELESQTQENINELATRIRDNLESGWANRGPGQCHKYPEAECRACLAFEAQVLKSLEKLATQSSNVISSAA